MSDVAGTCTWGGCKESQEENRNYCPAHLEQNRTTALDRKNRLRDAGLCVACGKVKVEPGYRKCPRCRALNRARQKKPKYRKQRHAFEKRRYRAVLGRVCVGHECGATDKETNWSGNKDYCNACYHRRAVNGACPEHDVGLRQLEGTGYGTGPQCPICGHRRSPDALSLRTVAIPNDIRYGNQQGG